MSSAARGGPAKGLVRKAWDTVSDFLMRKEKVGTDKHGNTYHRCACRERRSHAALHMRVWRPDPVLSIRSARSCRMRGWGRGAGHTHGAVAAAAGNFYVVATWVP
uniref:Uncharacterized protein n=1 Tax=Chlamydomonas euryale TaxID=1486919 RepID=A0A7R9W1N0_9CHLO|mmetsp:Transcript_9057/g.27601  ORF Transcript_9057/g.27601 Transcript_9057/m.27601 type:complete len:105 (+) Transcript_9057:509-823(+)|eukprot:354782-Chlamydomonas_euryale.AAC.4